MKNEQRAKLAKRAELPRVKLEYARNCRAPQWHRVEAGRAKLVRAKLARVKKGRQTGTGMTADNQGIGDLIVSGSKKVMMWRRSGSAVECRTLDREDTVSNPPHIWRR